MHGPSDYIIYVDESGTPLRETVDEGYPIFSLQLLVISKRDYAAHVAMPLVEFKLKHHGTDSVILRGKDIKGSAGPYGFLKDPQRSDQYFADLNALVANVPMSLYSGYFLHHEAIKSVAVGVIEPYALFLKTLLSRVSSDLACASGAPNICRVIVESRHENDQKMLEAFELYRASLDHSKISFEIEMVPKQRNVLGLQLVDLVASSVARSCLNPNTKGRDWMAIKDKVVCKMDLTHDLQFILGESFLG